jgi:photosystem II stability/assembly factor-like uncharacterized protein
MKGSVAHAAIRRRAASSQTAARAVVAAVLAYSLVATAFAASSEPSPPTPGRIARPTTHKPQDGDPAARRSAAAQLMPPYMTEEYKRNFLQELARQQSLYGNQMAGAHHPEGMPEWHSIGPRTSKYSWNGVFIDGVDSGRIRTILTDPGNNDHVYVLTSGGGLWVTRHFSAAQPQWRVLTDALLSTSGGSVAFGRDDETIYLGIGDPFDVYPTVAGVIVKSTDGGRTWGPIVSLPGATSVRDVKVDTSGATDTVFAATNVGLFISTDGGNSYALSSVGQSDARYDSWSIARSSAGWLLAAVDPSFETAAGTGQLYLSQDHGATWNAIAAGGDVFNSVGRATLALGQPGEAVVYAIASDPTGFAQADVYRSTDGGQSWAALNVTSRAPINPNCFQTDLNILGNQAWYNQMIVVSPKDKARNTLYIGGNLSTAKTTDGGLTWTLTSSWLPTACDGVTPQLPYVHADNHAATIVVDEGVERVVFGTDGGIFVSLDAGQSFDSSKNTGIVALLAQTINSTPRRDDSAITGLQDTGTRARIGSSNIWNQVSGGDGEGVGWSQANDAVTIATAEFDYILRQPGLPANTGSPNNWLDGTNGIDFNDLDCFPFFTPIATPTAQADPSGLVFYTFTGSRLYKTTDGAASWQQVTQFGTVAAPQCIIRQTWHNLGLHPTDPARIVLGGLGGRVIISKDGGASWNIAHLIGLVPGYVGFNSAPAWARNGTTLYVASEAATPGAVRLVKSIDGGATWNRADGSYPTRHLPDVAVSDIVVDPRDPQGRTVYAATSIGVYVTHDGGTKWRLFGAGLPNVSVRGLYLSPDEGFVRIATYGRGVWEIDTDDSEE